MIKQEDWKLVSPPRIGNAVALFIVGGSLLFLGVATLVASGGQQGPAAIANGLVGAGVSIVAVGFAINLFRNIESRLIDIQHVLIGQSNIAVNEPAIISKQPENISQETIMANHGINFDGAKYIFGEYRYDKLSDAVSYAEIVSRNSKGSAS